MGNEMGNNNVTGQQVSEETAKGFDKTIIDCLDGTPGLNNTNSEKNKEKDGTEDVDMSKSLKGPVISNGGDEQMALDQKNSYTKNEDLKEKNRASIQDHTSTQDDQNVNLPTARDDEPLKYKETETTPNSTETIVPVGTTVEDMTSNKGGSTFDEKIKQLVHETREISVESTIADSGSSLEENIEGSLEDEKESCSHEVAVVAGNLVGEDTVENLEQGQIGLSTVEDQLMPIKGETTSSTESIITDHIDADDSEIKEVVIEDEPRERDDSSNVRPADDTNQETSKNDNTGMPEEKEEICERNKTTTVETVIESGEVLEDKIHQDEDIPKCSASGSLDIGKVVSKFQSSFAGYNLDM